MTKKKIIQQKIVGTSEKKAGEEEFYNILRTIAPGTHIRTAIDGINKAGMGGLIVVYSELLSSLLDGGFRVNIRFTPQRLVELAKMDGAIILSNDMKRILFANVLLTPDNKTQSHETGTRHKAAERTARQASTLIIAVSERRKEITSYYKNIRYPIVNSNELLGKANEHMQMLDKQRELFDKALEKLNYSELRNYLSLNAAVEVIQKGMLVSKIAYDLKKFIIELGREGALLKTRLKEVSSDVEKECELVIKDYTNLDVKKSSALLSALSYEQLLDKNEILEALDSNDAIQTAVKGWRILSKTSLSEKDIAEIIKNSKSLGRAIHSSAKFHEGILGEEKSKLFKEQVENIKLNF